MGPVTFHRGTAKDGGSMSYIHMDHAGWIENEKAAWKKYKPTSRDLRAAAEHKGWYAAPDQLNEFHRRAFDLLGIVGGGIYNAPIVWKSVVWHPSFLCIPWRQSLATWDFSALTRFVFLCHEARIRGDISPSMRHLEIHLSARRHEGGMAQRHPDLDEAVAAWKAEFPRDHILRYCAPPAAVAAE